MISRFFPRKSQQPLEKIKKSHSGNDFDLPVLFEVNSFLILEEQKAASLVSKQWKNQLSKVGLTPHQLREKKSCLESETRRLFRGLHRKVQGAIGSVDEIFGELRLGSGQQVKKTAQIIKSKVTCRKNGLYLLIVFLYALINIVLYRQLSSYESDKYTHLTPPPYSDNQVNLLLIGTCNFGITAFIYRTLFETVSNCWEAEKYCDRYSLLPEQYDDIKEKEKKLLLKRGNSS